MTKNEIASKYGLKVGEPLWKARQKCPELVIVPPNFPLYIRFSKLARKIYEDYSDYIEPFGLDESWVDVTGLRRCGEDIANEIRNRVKDELGITVSIGVSFNKIFAKLGSDYKKPDAVTVFSKDNYKNTVWKLPCGDMLMVGKATSSKLAAYGIYTIGELACCDDVFLQSVLGKNGLMLKNFANGCDNSPVKHKDDVSVVKSVGNSTTTPRDLVNNNDIKTVFCVLSESVAMRLREQGLKGKTISISVRDTNLKSFTRQKQMKCHTDISTEILNNAMELFVDNYDWRYPVRAVGINVCDFDFEDCMQFDFYKSVEHRDKLEKIENTVDVLKKRFGNYCIQRASQLNNQELSHFNPYDEHIIHPIGYF